MRQWLGSGIWAIADQGLFAISNLVVNVLLARWLTPREYGAFAISYSLFLLLGTVHTAFLSEPMLIFGAGKYAADRPGYLKRLLRGHWIATGSCGVLLIAGGAFFAQLHFALLGQVLLGLGLAGPFILMSWLLRRACYIWARPQWAAAAGAAYLVLVVVGTALLSRQRALSIVSALAVLGLSSALASSWLITRLGRRTLDARADSPMATVRSDHWAYGRWAAGTGALSWLPTDLYYMVLPLWGGLEVSGALKALITLIMPLVQAQSAISNLLTPALVRVRGRPSFEKLLHLALAWCVVTSLGYWLLVGVLHRPLVHWLYGGRYDGYAAMLWLIGALPLLHGIGEVLSDALRARERPDQSFWAAVAASVATVAFGVGAAFLWGVAGVAVGQAISLAAAIASMWMFLARANRRPQSGSPRLAGGIARPSGSRSASSGREVDGVEQLG